jgi:cytochrome bd-type quinol oxidase subunit 2
MGRTLGLVVAVVMILVGGLWTFQGLGYVEGSSMTGSDTWAIIGPVVAGLGVALAVTVARGSRTR